MNTTETQGLDFEALVEEYYQRLFQFGCSLTKNEEWAKDLTQQTFLLAIRKEGQLRDKSKAKFWLFTILYREFLKKRRHEVRFPKQSIDDSHQELPATTSNSVARLDAATLMTALESMEERYRAPLVLFYQRDHSYLEIAEILGVPPGTVMSCLSRAKEKLRRILESAPRKKRVMAGLAAQLKDKLASLAPARPEEEEPILTPSFA